MRGLRLETARETVRTCRVHVGLSKSQPRAEGFVVLSPGRAGERHAGQRTR
jgi:hypothetical protein